MTPPAACEPLEGRRHFAAGLDPSFLVNGDVLDGVVGRTGQAFAAAPGKHDRTILAVNRGLKAGPASDPGVAKAGTLTFVAVDSAGRLDASFGRGGIADTGRVLNQPGTGGGGPPGILKVDRRGRLIFADATRVLRFRADGRIDRRFGASGAAGFNEADRTSQLCDVIPTDDDGVLVATTRTVNGKQTFSVHKLDANSGGVTWQSTHDTGGGDGLDEDGRYQFVNTRVAQFAAVRGSTVLVRIERDVKSFPVYNPIEPDQDTALGTVRQDAVVTRFDAEGRGTDVARRELRRASIYSPARLAGGSDRFPYATSVQFLDGGFTLTMLTDQEVLRFGLSDDSIRRANLPDDDRFAVNRASYRLLADGTVASVESGVDKRGRQVVDVRRYTLDARLRAKPFAAFGDDGTLRITRAEFPLRRNAVEQIFLGSGGGVYVFTGGTAVGLPADATLRRA